MKKRIFAVCAAVTVMLAALVFLSGSWTFDPGCEKLSQMSDEKVLEFVVQYDIPVEGFDSPSLDLPGFVRAIITAVENDPDVPCLYSFTDTCDLFEAVKAAVNSYYGRASS